MESAQVVLTKISHARNAARPLASREPDGAPWDTLFELLDFYEAMVRDHWPLTETEKEECRLGWFSVRNIEEAYPSLHDLVKHASYSLQRSGEI